MEIKNEKRFDFRIEDDVKKIRSRIVHSYKTKTGRTEGSDDCAQEIITRLLEGRHKHATIDQAVIDYLRQHRNLKGFRSRFKKQDYPVTHSYEQGEFDNFIGSDFGGDVDSRIDFDRLANRLRGFERCVTILHYKDDLSEKEIGYYFGVTESRVSQWLQRIKKRLSAREAQEQRSQRERSAELESVLRTKKNGNARGMEQKTNYSMEKEQSFEMESFSETCF